VGKIKNEELNNFSFLLGKNKGEVSKRRSKNKNEDKKEKAFKQIFSLIFVFLSILNPIKFVLLSFSSQSITLEMTNRQCKFYLL
jgi:hypothetical protein